MNPPQPVTLTKREELLAAQVNANLERRRNEGRATYFKAWSPIISTRVAGVVLAGALLAQYILAGVNRHTLGTVLLLLAVVVLTGYYEFRAYQLRAQLKQAQQRIEALEFAQAMAKKPQTPSPSSESGVPVYYASSSVSGRRAALKR